MGIVSVLSCRCCHYMFTISIRHKHQQTTDNTEHHIQNCNSVHNKQQHTTSTRRNKHIIHKRTHPTTRITYDKNHNSHAPTTLHNNRISNTQTQETNYIQQHKPQTAQKHIHTPIVNTYSNSRNQIKIP